MVHRSIRLVSYAFALRMCWCGTYGLSAVQCVHTSRRGMPFIQSHLRTRCLMKFLFHSFLHWNVSSKWLISKTRTRGSHRSVSVYTHDSTLPNELIRLHFPWTNESQFILHRRSLVAILVSTEISVALNERAQMFWILCATMNRTKHLVISFCANTG